MTVLETFVFLYCIGYTASVIYWSSELKKLRGRDADVAIIAILGISTYWPFLCLLGWMYNMISFIIKRFKNGKRGKKQQD